MGVALGLGWGLAFVFAVFWWIERDEAHWWRDSSERWKRLAMHWEERSDRWQERAEHCTLRALHTLNRHHDEGDNP